MLRSRIIALATAALATFSIAAPANAWGLASAARTTPATRAAAPPLQFQVFCLMNPMDCRRSRLSSVAYDAHVSKLLAEVNNQVNRQIKPRADKGPDVWTISSSFGDCDDYVVTKRHKLIQAGLPASALRIAIVKTQSGEGHAVLVVKTSAGELVLDNLRTGIVSRQASGYRSVTISTADPHRWSS